MEQIIFKNGKYVTNDKKIPTMKALLLTDGTLTASADAFILTDLAPDATVFDLKTSALIPAFTDTCSNFYKLAVEKSEDSDFNTAIRELSMQYLQSGITTAAVADITAEDFNKLKDADKAGALLIDIAVYFTREAAEDLLPKTLPVDVKYDGHIRTAGVSVKVDDFSSADTLSKLFAIYITNHQQLMINVNTTTAINTVINAYREALINVNGSKTDEDGNVKPKIYEDLRPIITGAANINENQLTLLQSLGFTPSFSHDNIYYNGDDYIKALDKDIYENLYPLRSIVKRGMAFSVSHFETANMPDELFTMLCETNRQSSSGFSVGFEQTINTDQALFSQTIFGSYQLFEDLYKGSLTMTKKADLVVLSANPLEESSEALSKMKIEMVIKDGKIVYKK